MTFSLIIPVYNRPAEVDELLASLTRQSYKDFEVIVVEDGSTLSSRDVCNRYAQKLSLQYIEKPNSGPGESRNRGAEAAQGEYLIILDSDIVAPDNYLHAIHTALQAHPCDAFGGPDAAHPSFTPTQKAISYSMTSFFTTGGIRGGKKQLDRFYPRSFNMGIRRDVYQQLHGFSHMRFGEDIDFSYRIVEAGLRTRLIPEAWVWHKRRTDFRKFFRQVFNSGIARINLGLRHPGTTRLVHLLPAAFTLGTAMCLLAAIVGMATCLCATSEAPSSAGKLLLALGLAPLLFYSALIAIDATLRHRSLRVGLLAVPAAFVQLTGYGMGFLTAWWRRRVKGNDEFQAFEKNFYK